MTPAEACKTVLPLVEDVASHIANGGSADDHDVETLADVGIILRNALNGADHRPLLERARIALTFYREWMAAHCIYGNGSTHYPFGIEVENELRALAWPRSVPDAGDAAIAEGGQR